MKARMLLMLSMAFVAAPARAGPGYCKGRVWDASGQSIRVSLHVDDAGTIGSREAFWEIRSSGDRSVQGLSLEIGYVSGTPNGIGPPTSVDLNFLAMRNPPNLAGAEGTLELAPGQSWTARYQGMMGMGLVQLAVKTPWGGRLNAELVDAIENSTQATATLRERDGKVIASMTINPSDHAIRDRMFREALATAQQLASAAARCDNS